MTAKLKAFIPISKVDEEKRMVWGYASTEALDSQNEVVTRAAIAGALDGYMQFANIREMHQLSAVGVAKEATMDDKGLFLGAHVVDDTAWTKVKAGVYKGFSIGGKSLKKTGKTIEELALTEISLVDRPANPECVFDAWKADGAEGGQPGEDEVEIDLTAKAAPAAATETDAEPVAKGMWNMQRLVDALASVGNSARDAEWEASRGEHSPEIIAGLKAVVADLGAIAQKYLGEEIALMLAPQAGIPVALADAGGDVAKAGAKFSAATKASLKAAHDALKAANDALTKLGYDADDEDDDASKAVISDETRDAITKAAIPGVTDGALYDDVMKAVLADRDVLKARIAELEKEPEAPKGVLKAISKGEDAANGGADTKPPATPLDAVKAALAQPIAFR